MTASLLDHNLWNFRYCKRQLAACLWWRIRLDFFMLVTASTAKPTIFMKDLRD